MSTGGQEQRATRQVEKYYAGWHMVLCLSARDLKIYDVMVNDVSVYSEERSGKSELKIDAPEALGGLEREGGVVGTFQVYTGGLTQETSPYLQSQLPYVPGYTGVVSVVCEKAYLQANNPYLFPFKFKVGCWHNDWYEEKLVISADEKVYETVTTEPEDNFDDDVSQGVCYYSGWNAGECTISGYGYPADYPNGAIIDDPDSWACTNPTSLDPQVTCSDYKFIGAGVGSATGGTSTTTTVTTKEARIGMNGVHIVREALTNKYWGRGIDDGLLDDAGFMEAADVVYEEGLAISISWDKQTSILDFIQVIMDHIGGILTRLPGSGLYTIKLIRDGQPTELDILPQNIVSFDSYEERGWAGTTNEMTVKYTDIGDGKTKSVTVHDLAAIERQGDLIPETRDYPGLPTISLAQKIAERDLRIATSAGAKISITVDRVAYKLVPGSNFAITWDEYGLSSTVFRAVDIDYGKQDSNEIRIGAISDAPVSILFSLPDTVSQNEPTSSTPLPPLNANPRAIYEAPYWHVAKSVAVNGFPSPLADHDSYLIALGGKPHSTVTKFRSLFQRNSVVAEEGAFGYWSGSVLTMSGTNRTETDLFIDRTYYRSLERFTPGTLAVLGKNEIVEVVELKLDTWHLIVNRGMLDTVPVEHNESVLINTIGYEHIAFSFDTWLPGDSAKAWLQTVTSQSTLPLEDTSEIAISVVGSRQGRPLPPGGVSVNGAYLGVVFSGPLTIDWASRNRKLQTTDQHVTQSDGNVTPETGTTYEIRLYDEANAVLRVVELDETYTSYTYPVDDELADSDDGSLHARLRFELLSKRDGYESWTLWDHTVFRADSMTEVQLENPDFDTGDLTGWTPEQGGPIARNTENGMSFGGCGDPATTFVLGNSPSNPNDAWSVSQTLDLRDITSQESIDNGLTVLEFQTSHRAESYGPTCEMRVDYFDINEVYIGSERGSLFYFSYGVWATQKLYATSPPGGVYAKFVVTASGVGGGSNLGYVGCISAVAYGVLGEKTYSTALLPEAVVDGHLLETSGLKATALLPQVVTAGAGGQRASSTVVEVLSSEGPITVPSATTQAVSQEIPVNVESCTVCVIVSN